MYTQHRTHILTAATTGSALHALTLPDGHCGLGVGRGRAHTFLDLAGHGQEGLFDVGCALRRRFEKWDAEAVCEFLHDTVSTLLLCWARRQTYLRHGVLDHLLISHIGLVAHQQLVDALSSISVNLLKPLLHVVERVHVGDIVHHTDAVGTSVVRGGDCTETLLASCVPLLTISILRGTSQLWVRTI